MGISTLLVCDLLLLVIFFQDLKFRAVHWLLFPATLAVAGFGLFLSGTEWHSWSLSTLLNLCFLVLNLSVLSGWFIFKGINLQVILAGYIGIGDVLFFLIMALVLPFPVFPFVFVLSLIAALLCGFIFFRASSVPLAGLQSIVLAAVLTLDFFQLITIDQFYLLGV